MVALDDRAALDLTAFDHVGINGALGKMVALAQLFGFFLEDLHKVAADDLALLFRIGHALQVGEEALGRVRVNQLHREGLGENIHHLIALAGAHEAVVYVYAGQTVANGAVEKRGGHGAVHAAGKAQKNGAVAHLLTDLAYGDVNVGFHAPVAAATADIHQEVFQKAGALVGVGHFGVELHAVHPALIVAHGRHRAGHGVSQHPEAFRGLLHLIGVAHPAMAGGAHAVGKGIVHIVYLHDGAAVFPLRAAFNGRAVQMGHQLHSVANTQDRHTHPKNFFIYPGRIRIQYAGRATGEDHALRFQRPYFLRRRRVGQHQGIYVQFSYSPGDQLGILSAKVQNDYALRFFRHVCFTPSLFCRDLKIIVQKRKKGKGMFFRFGRLIFFCLAGFRGCYFPVNYATMTSTCRMRPRRGFC